MVNRLTTLLRRFGDRVGFQRDWYLILLAALIGTITAFGAIGFVWLLHKGEEAAHMLFGGGARWSLLLLPLLPMAGALATGILVHFGAREAKGHGVPEVIDAIYTKRGMIRPRVAIVKTLASACTIGSGGSAGAEGPIVQIGSAIGSGLAQWIGVSKDQLATLLGCGAAAGIASVFNAPIAGVFFVLEILLRDFSLKTFTPIVVASVFSTAVTQAVLGKNEALFAVGSHEPEYQFTIPELPGYLVLGLVCGVVAVGFVRLLYKFEDVYDKIRLHPILKPVTGAALLGILGIGFLLIVRASDGRADVPPFFGNGYGTIIQLLKPASYAGIANPETGSPLHAASALPAVLWVLALLTVCKIVATSCTLGSGGSGGVFAPSLFIGASSGAAFGLALERIGLLPENSSPASYALVGMAAVVAGTTHAPLTAILILFEITRDVYVLLPIMLAAVVSVVTAQLLMRDSIYSLKLRRRGILLGTAADLTLLRRLTARDIAPGPYIPILPDDPVSKLLDLRNRYRINDFVIADQDNIFAGMVTSEDLREAVLAPEAVPYLLVSELMRRDLPTILPDETLDRVMDKFSRYPVASLALVDATPSGGGRVTGLITRARLMDRYQQALRE